MESLNKIVGLQACNFIKKGLRHRCLPVNVAKFLRTVFSIEHLWWLVLFLLEREEEVRTGKRGTKQRGKVFQMKEEKVNISFNFYLQVLPLQIFQRRNSSKR